MDAWRQALRRMRETGRPGLLVVVPLEGEELFDFGEALLADLRSPRSEFPVLQQQAEFVFLRPAPARELCPSAEPGAHVHLLSFEGVPVASERLDVFHPAPLWEAARRLLHARLDAAADAALASLPDGEREEVLEAIDEARRTDERSDLLRKRARILLPLFVREGFFDLVLAARWAERHLPWGVVEEHKPYGEIFGTELDPCPACGLPSPMGRSRIFVHYLAIR
jgi:hypothetical protein